MSPPRPDALMMPFALPGGESPRAVDDPGFRARVAHITDLAAPILQVDWQAGELCCIRKQHGGVVFITRDPDDTIWHPSGHRKEGQERYHWEDKGRGVKFGWLLEPPEPPSPPEPSMEDFLRSLAHAS